MKTLAVVLYKLNSPLVIEELEIPGLQKGQVLVKMLFSGICRSQLNEINGFKGEDKYLPHMLGHEGSGEVLEIGEGVTKVKKGDRVVLTWILSKGIEGGPVKYSLNGKMVNSGPIATFTQYSIVSENRLVKINKEIPPDYASLLGCAVPTGAGIMINTLKDCKGDNLVVFGCGGIGGAVIMGAKMRGIKNIVAVDINPRALVNAKKLGATDTILFDPKSVTLKIKKLFPNGADIAVEATGNKIAMEKAIESVKDNGVVVISGNIKKGDTIMLDPFDLIKGKRLLGTWGGEASPDKDIPRYVTSYKNGSLPLDKMIGGKLPLKDINKALQILSEGKSFGRLLIEFK